LVVLYLFSTLSSAFLDLIESGEVFVALDSALSPKARKRNEKFDTM